MGWLQEWALAGGIPYQAVGVCAARHYTAEDPQGRSYRQFTNAQMFTWVIVPLCCRLLAAGPVMMCA
jgi:hypothetical protein